MQGTLFFSILDTRKVRTLGLERCQLTAVNFVILATAVSCVTRANLSHTQLDTDQVLINYILALRVRDDKGKDLRDASGMRDNKIISKKSRLKRL